MAVWRKVLRGTASPSWLTGQGHGSSSKGGPLAGTPHTGGHNGSSRVSATG